MSDPEFVERQCGDCQACCTHFEIEEAKTPERQPCQHQCKQGCAIYTERPERCQTYRCWWLQGDPSLKARDRPDRLGVIFDKRSKLADVLQGLKCVVAHEIRPGAFKTKRAARWLQTLATDRIVIQVAYSGKRKVIGPRPLLAELDRRQGASEE